MDTCLLLTELDIASVDTKLRHARECLQRFSFAKYQSRESEMTISASEKRWNDFLELGSREAQTIASSGQSRDWLRVVGSIEIDDYHHGIEIFIYPITRAKAVASIAFSGSLYKAVYSFKPFYEDVIDLDVKRDVVSLLLLMATSLSAEAFAFKPLTNPEDLVLPIRVADIRDWLTAPTHEMIHRWPFLIVGIRAEMVERGEVKEKWPSERIVQSSSGFLIYDGIYPSNDGL